MGAFAGQLGKPTEAELFKTKAEKVLESFNKVFWNERGQYLYDYVDGDFKNDDIRPNQIYAISLPYPLLDEDKAGKVLNVVENNLLTPRGLRSLAPSHKDYRKTYGGDVWSRDGAYHQGTVWSFLMGPFIDALLKTRGEDGKTTAQGLLDIFLTHLSEGCIGTLSEIFDGEVPHAPRGCVAQAWSVGEILRVGVVYDLFKKKMSKQEREAVEDMLKADIG
jgi:glycogen debranching enzyme